MNDSKNFKEFGLISKKEAGDIIRNAYGFNIKNKHISYARRQGYIRSWKIGNQYLYDSRDIREYGSKLTYKYPAGHVCLGGDRKSKIYKGEKQ